MSRFVNDPLGSDPDEDLGDFLETVLRSMIGGLTPEEEEAAAQRSKDRNVAKCRTELEVLEQAGLDISNKEFRKGLAAKITMNVWEQVGCCIKCGRFNEMLETGITNYELAYELMTKEG